MKHFFSIIMPAYNVEKYIGDSIKCIIKQTFRDYELIIVNDCSTDGTRQIIQEYIDKNSDIDISCIDHDVNQGLSMARNTGIEYASGKYITFLDSDDTYSYDLLNEAYKSLQQNAADAVMYGVKEKHYKNEKLQFENDVIVPSAIYRSKEEVRNSILDLEKSTLFPYATDKFFRLDKIKEQNLKFKKIDWIEDNVFNIEFFQNVSSLNIIGSTLYNYNLRNNGSLTKKYKPNYWKCFRKKLILYRDMYEGWDMYSNDVKSALGSLYCRYTFSFICRSLNANKSIKTMKKWLIGVYKDPLFEEIVPYAYSNRTLGNTMNKMIRSKQTNLIVSSAACVSVLRGAHFAIFDKLRNASFR